MLGLPACHPGGGTMSVCLFIRWGGSLGWLGSLDARVHVARGRGLLAGMCRQYTQPCLRAAAASRLAWSWFRDTSRADRRCNQKAW